MCLGVPGEIVELNADLPEFAEAEVNGVRRAINIGLLEPRTLTPGDWVLIHLGFALSKIDEAEAKATLDFLTGSGRTDTRRNTSPSAELIAITSSQVPTATGIS
ncbi:HypC/HybG/HupF family hydrogenase formation chaperone [Candidatus Mycobacterium methanotrophicum]|uniref:HypC/HybG/HupF family hydrogenase formation chaperone n=1 Tax=Candidatus Mycobacterium methanotrophicum TaxID=2943498 RepID=A0ABY4QNS7_9MYCO|nr:HypC/HybG/HupF family hydrogenase formation chaperone [Candidatus Mycobacterium methanotrophicum]UQX11275.1 HypC/HybG/HupF family hydrogenase formation chaperone [Candidatus Mycobacterium methanotrophicum]